MHLWVTRQFWTWHNTALQRCLTIPFSMALACIYNYNIPCVCTRKDVYYSLSWAVKLCYPLCNLPHARLIKMTSGSISMCRDGFHFCSLCLTPCCEGAYLLPWVSARSQSSLLLQMAGLEMVQIRLRNPLVTT